MGRRFPMHEYSSVGHVCTDGPRTRRLSGFVLQVAFRVRRRELAGFGAPKLVELGLRVEDLGSQEVIIAQTVRTAPGALRKVAGGFVNSPSSCSGDLDFADLVAFCGKFANATPPGRRVV